MILGQGYDTSTDLWSLACMVFELATGDLLFDPREAKDRSYSRDEDHLALMMELAGASGPKLRVAVSALGPAVGSARIRCIARRGAEAYASVCSALSLSWPLWARETPSCGGAAQHSST